MAPLPGSSVYHISATSLDSKSPCLVWRLSDAATPCGKAIWHNRHCGITCIHAQIRLSIILPQAWEAVLSTGILQGFLQGLTHQDLASVLMGLSAAALAQQLSNSGTRAQADPHAASIMSSSGPVDKDCSSSLLSDDDVMGLCPATFICLADVGCSCTASQTSSADSFKISASCRSGAEP